eukprot:gene7067-7862_t
MKKFSQVFHSDTPHKVSAAIVMAKSINETLTDCFEVISIGTGTKCIGGSSINNAGHVINDCHAEIIACRGLRQFLFDQLCLAIDNKDTCLEKMKNQNKTVGVLRTKIENGQGTVPVPSNKVQTTDGILEGERLLTMSCSDKILRWNVLGLQGSLLRNALPFKCVKPSFGHCPSTDGRDTSKAPNNSYNWYYGQNTVEIINAITAFRRTGYGKWVGKPIEQDTFS